MRAFARCGSGISVGSAGQRRTSVINGSVSVVEEMSLSSSLSVRSYVRGGKGLSALGFAQVGSSFSMRGYGRLGSGISCIGLVRCGSIYTASVISFLTLGSSVSVRSYCRTGSAISSLGFAHIGSSCSVRGMTRFGSAVSILGGLRVGAAAKQGVSCMSFLQIGSSVSLRSFARIGKDLSCYSTTFMGSSLSVRAFTRVGSSVSILGKTNMGAMSVLGCVNIGSSMSLRSFSRTGNALSALDFVSIGSCMSVRSFVRLGSSLSAKGLINVANGIDTPSIMDRTAMGSSLSIRSYVRCGSAMSTMSFGSIGSSVSLRGCFRCGSSFSVIGKARVGQGLSLMGCMQVASTLSTRAWARFGDCFSVFDAISLGSALSTRSFVMLGSALSVFGEVKCRNKLSIASCSNFGSSVSVRSFVRVGSAVSALSFAHCGSSVSVRSFIRAGSATSVLDFTNFASAVSIRSFVRLSSSLSIAGNTCCIGKAKIFVNSAASGTSASPQVHIYADENNAQQSMSMYSGSGSPAYGGTLHGTWVSTSTLTSSDRRMKYDVLPLFKTIMKQHQHNLPQHHMVEDLTDSSSSSSHKLSGENAVMSSIIKQIRPVSFKYKKHTDSKYNRYGFIAQELEAVLPSVIMTDKASGMKAVNYNDMIAVLALGIQSIDSRITNVDTKLNELADKQDDYYMDLSDRLKVMENSFAKLFDKTKAEQSGDLAVVKTADSSEATSINATSTSTDAVGKKQDSSVNKKIQALLNKIDFGGPVFKSWPQERKEKLRVKLAEHGIDLNDLLPKEETTPSTSNSTTEVIDSVSDSDEKAPDVDLTKFDESQTIESPEDQGQYSEQLAAARDNKKSLRASLREKAADSATTQLYA